MNRRLHVFNVSLLVIFLAVVSCSDTSPKLVPPPAPVPTDKVINSANGETFEPKVDILFVIANDTSMFTYQPNLINNAAQFTAEIIKNKILDYHIGVTSAMGTNQRRGGAWGGRLAGKFVTPKS